MSSSSCCRFASRNNPVFAPNIDQRRAQARPMIGLVQQQHTAARCDVPVLRLRFHHSPFARSKSRLLGTFGGGLNLFDISLSK